MELKDMILSTLAELEDASEEVVQKKQTLPDIKDEVREEYQENIATVKVENKENQEQSNTKVEVVENENVLDDEKHFCESMRERILVLFEGFQSPNNKSIEAKVDLTLNFLEYSLAVLDERLDKIDKK